MSTATLRELKRRLLVSGLALFDSGGESFELEILADPEDKIDVKRAVLQALGPGRESVALDEVRRVVPIAFQLERPRRARRTA